VRDCTSGIRKLSVAAIRLRYGDVVRGRCLTFKWRLIALQKGLEWMA